MSVQQQPYGPKQGGEPIWTWSPGFQASDFKSWFHKFILFPSKFSWYQMTNLRRKRRWGRGASKFCCNASKQSNPNQPKFVHVCLEKVTIMIWELITSFHTAVTSGLTHLCVWEWFFVVVCILLPNGTTTLEPWSLGICCWVAYLCWYQYCHHH